MTYSLYDIESTRWYYIGVTERMLIFSCVDLGMICGPQTMGGKAQHFWVGNYFKGRAICNF